MPARIAGPKVSSPTPFPHNPDPERASPGSRVSPAAPRKRDIMWHARYDSQALCGPISARPPLADLGDDARNLLERASGCIDIRAT
jgi:hypothetical protein